MMEHIGTIIARVVPAIAARTAKWGIKHEQGCPYWERFEPEVCACEVRPLVDLLLTIAQRKAA